MGAMEEAPENTNIRKMPKTRMLGETRIEEEHGENLISFIRKYELK